jgi:uncharacterized membrane protein (DUF373 family)
LTSDFDRGLTREKRQRKHLAVKSILRLIDRYELFINAVVLVLMALVLLALLIGLGVDIWQSFTATPLFQFSAAQAFTVFGDLLLILVGLELMHTVKIYLQDHTVHVELILVVALVAVARKVIVASPQEYTAMTVMGLALLILSLAASYALLVATKRQARGDAEVR